MVLIRIRKMHHFRLNASWTVRRIVLFSPQPHVSHIIIITSLDGWRGHDVGRPDGMIGHQLLGGLVLRDSLFLHSIILLYVGVVDRRYWLIVFWADHISLQDHIVWIVAATAHWLPIIVILIWGLICRIWIRRRLFASDCSLLGAISITDTTDNLFILVLKLLDALLELLELLGEIHPLFVAGSTNYLFYLFLSLDNLRLHY